jgi:hypothetical protein
MKMGRCLACLWWTACAHAGMTAPSEPGLFEVSLRDSRSVEIAAVGPAGLVSVSPRDSPPSTVYLPDAAFAITATDCRGGRLTREPNGSIVLERARCPTRDENGQHGMVGYAKTTLVHVDGSIEPHAFRWENDALVWDTVLSRRWCAREDERRRRCAQWDNEPVVSVELRTPRDNVRSMWPYAPPPPGD